MVIMGICYVRRVSLSEKGYQMLVKIENNKRTTKHHNLLENIYRKAS